MSNIPKTISVITYHHAPLPAPKQVTLDQIEEGVECIVDLGSDTHEKVIRTRCGTKAYAVAIDGERCRLAGNATLYTVLQRLDGKPLPSVPAELEDGRVYGMPFEDQLMPVYYSRATDSFYSTDLPRRQIHQFDVSGLTPLPLIARVTEIAVDPTP